VKDCGGDAETQRNVPAYCVFKVNGARLKAAATNSEAKSKAGAASSGPTNSNQPSQVAAARCDETEPAATLRSRTADLPAAGRISG